MPKEWIKVITSVYIVLTRDNKILLHRRHHTPFCNDQYCFPAGHPHSKDETLRQALARETKEEIGTEVDLADLELIHVIHRKQLEPIDQRRLHFFFRAKKWKGVPRNMEPDRHDDLRWFEIDDIPNNTIGYVKQAIDCFRNKIRYSEYGF